MQIMMNHIDLGDDMILTYTPEHQKQKVKFLTDINYAQKLYKEKKISLHPSGIEVATSQGSFIVGAEDTSGVDLSLDMFLGEVYQELESNTF